MNSETRNTGIMIAVVITSIIIVFLVLFIRPKETQTIERVVDNQLLVSIEGKINKIEARLNSIETTFKNITGLGSDIEIRLEKFENSILEKENEINQLKGNITTIVVIGIILFIIIIIVIIRPKIKLPKLVQEEKKKEEPLNIESVKNNDNENNIETKIGEEKDNEINTEEKKEFAHSHGSFYDLSGREQKSALNSSFTPNEN